MRLSIIMPTFNQGNLIAQAIESLLAQPMDTDIELIVMDGGSRDNTQEIVEGYRQRLQGHHINLVFVSEPDHGQSDAINKGVRRSTGEVLGVLCSDDYFEPNVLSQVAAFFMNHPDVSWAYGGWKFVDLDRRVFSTTQPTHFRRSELEVLCPIGMPSCFYRKEFLINVGLVNENLHLSMDYDMWFRMARESDPAVLPFVVSNMRYYQLTKSATKTLAHLKESFRLQKKYTRGLGTRLRQYWYFFRGLVMIGLRQDVTSRVERWRRTQPAINS